MNNYIKIIIKWLERNEVKLNIPIPGALQTAYLFKKQIPENVLGVYFESDLKRKKIEHTVSKTKYFTTVLKKLSNILQAKIQLSVYCALFHIIATFGIFTQGREYNKSGDI